MIKPTTQGVFPFIRPFQRNTPHQPNSTPHGAIKEPVSGYDSSSGQLSRGLSGLLLFALLPFGCAQPDQEMRNIETKLRSMQVRQNRTQDRVEELATYVDIVRAQLKEHKKQPTNTVSKFENKPPELEVVKVGPAAPPAQVEYRKSLPDAEYTLVGQSETPVQSSVHAPLRVRKVPPVPPSRKRSVHGTDGHKNEYGAALAAYRRGDAQRARALFMAFANDYPKDRKSPAALHWSGVCLFELENYVGAISTFATLMQRHPRAEKVPEALLKSGIAYLRLGDTVRAKRSFATLKRKFPDNALADLARVRIAQLERH